MAQFVNIYPVDLQKGPIEVSLNRMYMEDIKANRVGVTVTDGGAAVTLGGTCSATAILSNGSTVAISGTISGNQAYIELPSAVYTVDGPVEVFVNLTNGGVTATLLHGHGTVVQTDTGTVIDPGTIIPSVSALIDDIDAAVASIPADYSALLAAVAPAFSSSTAYTAGRYVWNSGNLYRFTADHAAGSWTGTDAVQVVVTNEIADLKSALNAVQDADNAGTFTYNSFCQGQRLQNNPTSIQAVDDRCTTESLLRLHKGDEITITTITSGQSVYVYSRTTTSGWKTGTLYYCVPADGEYWVNIKNGDDDISPTDISYGLNIYVNTVANGAKREADSLSERMKAVDGKYYLDPKNFDIGNIQISGSGWNYPDNNTTRVRTKEGVTYRLNVGDIISLSDYTNAQFYFGWLNTSDVYKTAGSWKTSDYAVTETGDYVILIANKTEATQTSIDALFNLLSIKQSGYELKRINTEFDNVKQEFVGMLYGTSFMPTFTNQMYNVNQRKFFSNDNRVSFDKPYPVQNGWKINIDVATGEQYYMLYMNKVADTGVLDDDYEYISGSATGWKTEDKEYTGEGNTYVFIMVAKTTDNTPINKDTVQTKITFTRNYETGDADLPVYWDSYMQGKVEDIKEAMDDVGGIGDAFVFYTDPHWGSKNQKHTPQIIKYLLENTSLRSVYCGGDVIDSGSGGFTEYCKAFREITVFTARGNHDQNPNATDPTDIVPDSEYYNRILKPIEYLVNTDGRLYYYRDNSSEKIRYIFMDSGSNRADTLDATQLTWMQNALTELESDWSALVIQHIVFNGAEASVATLNFAGQGNTTINAINAVWDQMQCQFIGIISGHVHRDYSTTDATNGYPIIATSCDVGDTGRTDYDPDNGATPGTTDEQIMDVFIIDKSNRTITVKRVGAGSDRSFTYPEHS